MNNFISIDFSQVITYILLAIIAIVGVVITMLSYRILNVIPAKWLCDYDEEPDETLLGERYNYKQSGIYTSALFAVFLLLCYTVFGNSLYTLFMMLISFVLLLITLCDFKYTIIPDQFVVILAVLCLGMGIFDLFSQNYFIQQWWHIPVGAVCGGGFLFAINLLSILLLKKHGMGFGDVKLMAALGACIGFPKTFIALLLAVIVSFVFIICKVVANAITKKDDSSYFPFGPFLCLGSLFTILFDYHINAVIKWYISLITIN